jgi:hypothetical protein
MHLFVKCTELYNFHMYVSKQVEELFENCVHYITESAFHE